jgi:hypothetical protein
VLLLAGCLLPLAGCGDSITSPLDQAQEHYRAAQWDRAVAACDDVLRQSPDSIDALLLRGRARLAAGQPEPAVADFAEVIRLAPNNPEGFYQRSLAYSALGKTEEADADQEHARAIDLQDAALLRRHTSTLKTPQLVHSEPDKQAAEADGKDSSLTANPPDHSDDFQLRLDAANKTAREQTTGESPLLAPVPAGGPLSDPASIVGGTSLLDSPLLKTPLVPRPVKAPSKSPPEATGDNEKPKSTPSPAAQSGLQFSPRNFATSTVQSDRRSAGTHRSSNSRDASEVGEEQTARKSKYPIARLNFISQPAGTAPVADGVTRSRLPTLQPPSLQPPSLALPRLRPPSLLVDLGLASPPDEADDEETPEEPGFVAIQVRGFTPDAPPWPLSMPSQRGKRRAFETPSAVSTGEPAEPIATSADGKAINAERKMPAPRKAPPRPKLSLQE